MHEIVIKENEFTAHVNSLIIELVGKSAHAAEPEHGVNPSGAVSEILNLENNFGNPDPEVQIFFSSRRYTHDSAQKIMVSPHILPI